MVLKRGVGFKKIRRQESEVKSQRIAKLELLISDLWLLTSDLYFVHLWHKKKGLQGPSLRVTEKSSLASDFWLLATVFFRRLMQEILLPAFPDQQDQIDKNKQSNAADGNEIHS